MTVACSAFEVLVTCHLNCAHPPGLAVTTAHEPYAVEWEDSLQNKTRRFKMNRCPVCGQVPSCL